MPTARLLALFLVLAAPAAARPAAPAHGDLIVFASNRSPARLDHVFTAAVGRPARLRSLAVGTDAAYSPDRRRIAFVRGNGLNQDGTEIALVDADGSGLRTIFRQPADEQRIAGWAPLQWSPDGSRVAFFVYGPTIGVLDVRTGRVAWITGAQRPSWSPDGRRLAFEGSESYPYQLETAAADGSDRRPLGPPTYRITPPVWSPRGVWLVFGAEYANSGFDLYRIRPDGSGLRRLAHDSASEELPSWSPDGTRIAYFRSDTERSPARYTLRTIGLDGRGARDLAVLPLPPFRLSPPAWTRDGRRIAIANGGLRIVDARHGGARLLRPGARASAFTSGPQWSLDGRRLLFSAHMGHKDYDLYLVRPDGTGLRRLTTDPAEDRAPAWSPDGTRIALVRRSSGGGGIVVIRADGRLVARVTHDRSDSAPTWSPDGRRLAFVRRSAIWTVRPDGRDARFLAAVPFAPRRISWSPSGSAIAYSDGNEIQLVDVATGFTKQVATGVGGGLEPTWSPDGSHLVFTSYRDARYFRDPQAWGLFQSSAAGGPAAKLVTGYLFWPSVAPDSTQIATQGEGSISVVDLRTSTVTQIIGYSGSPVDGYAREPAWRP